MGVDGAERGRLDRTLTNRTMSGRAGWSAKGCWAISPAISRPSHIMISASKGNLRVNSARSWSRVTGRRITKVPAAPMFTASRCLSCSASLAGRKVL